MKANGFPGMKISLLTGCNDKHYQIGLLSGLVNNGAEVDFIGNDDMKEAEHYANTRYLNLRGNQDPEAGTREKISRVLVYYWKLFKYAATTDSPVFHIQWLNKFVYFDRTLLNIYYKALGKKLVYTAHNIDATVRDGGGSFFNRWTLGFMYKSTDHIIVHTEKMKQQLIDDFGIVKDKISVIPHGIHNAIPETELTPQEARNKLGIRPDEQVMLFFGNILPYKGLEYLLLALKKLREHGHDNVRLIVAGRINKDPAYKKKIDSILAEHDLHDCVDMKTEFIPDDDVEVLYKSADVCILPYVYIFQSGILFVSYNFGLPVIATDVGSLREEIIENETGYICKPEDPDDLAEKIEQYFNSELYRNLSANRLSIREYARDKYSWNKVGEKTVQVYKGLSVAG